MKRNIVIAAAVSAVLIGGGTATAAGYSGDDEASAAKTTTVSLKAHDDDRDDSGREDDGRDDGRDDDRRDDDRDDQAQAKLQNGSNTVADAIAAALKHTPGTVASADLDADDDSHASAARWDVEIVKAGGTEHTVEIDPKTGKVLGTERDDDDADDRDADDRAELAALKAAQTDASEAAQATAAKGAVLSVDLDDDHGTHWDVETAQGDYRVDLKTGKVTADREDD